VLEETVTLAPGETDTLAATAGDDPRLADLFSHKRMRGSVTARVHPTGLAPLAGRLTLTRLDAVVICRRSGL
jgi:hypothetical protein